MLAAIFLLLRLLFQAPGQGQQGQPPGQQPSPTPATQQPRPTPSPTPEQPPVVTRHEIRVGGSTIKYTAIVAMMPIKNREGETEASMFFTSYIVDQPNGAPPRPLTFSFNGGPGSASVWLHMVASVPKRVKMNADGGRPSPPFELVDNEGTWLTKSDLVFIDPVGTGYSRPARPELGQKFFGLQGDIESVGEFIRMYHTRYERWTSPLFLAGESYGTTRASALSGYLIDRGIAFNGIMLISTIMNFETTAFASGNDLPYALFLPSYAATAWYHKKLPSDLQSKPVGRVVQEAESFASGEYMLALEKGSRLSAQERQDMITKLARFTGLDAKFLDYANLRVNLNLFRKELLRSERRSIGRLDSRFKGYDSNLATDSTEYDASEAAIRPPYTATYNNYVRSELGYKTDLENYILGGGIGPWNWGTNNNYVDSSTALRNSLAKNPFLKVFVAMVYYDMATPYFAVEYTLGHISIDASLMKNFSTSYFDAGLMMYIDEKSLTKLHSDVTKFMDDSMKR